MRRGALFGFALLAGCGSAERAPAPAASASASAVAPVPGPTAPQPAPAAPSPSPSPHATHDLAVLDSRDCAAVVQAYVDALARADYAFAARVWDDPAVDSARLKALFADYRQPAIAFTGSEQEGAAGSSYCTVSGTLTDSGDPAKKARKGQIVLKRVNDVPGATPRQLRWTIRSSSFIEKIERSR